MKPIFVVMFLIPILCAAPAHAMHISEGILPFNWALFWYLVMIPFLALGIRKLRAAAKEEISFKPLWDLSPQWSLSSPVCQYPCRLQAPVRTRAERQSRQSCWAPGSASSLRPWHY